MKSIYVFLLLASSVVWCSAQQQISAEQLKVIQASSPAPLPQEPVVEKALSDAKDEGLKGKVRSVIQGSQDLSGTGYSQDKKLSYIKDYNESGNVVRRISFDYRGNPDDITVYGYLNGLRVSKTNSIRYSYDPPPIALPPAASGNSQKEVGDSRITYSYSYKYVAGHLSEMQMFHNNGRPGMRYTYTRNGDQLVNLVYDNEGNLNQKYVYVLDKSGNEIEEQSIDLTPRKYYGDKRYSFIYDSFDKEGNWTKKTAYEITVQNGKEVRKPSYVQFRTIRYY